MNKTKIFLSVLLIAFLASCGTEQQTGDTAKYQVETITDANGYNYEIVSNDPMGVRIYTLKNGLKVYLSVNKDEPRIQTYIPVKAGSTYDPKETTGLAHYLEHMMFKGTSKFGTLDWEKEKPLLDEISDLYEQHKNEQDLEKKKAIYAKIDSVSALASKFALANEYDKMVSVIGAKGTNAHTWHEKTVYINNIPSNELERWLALESERFGELVLRLFHTELEAVYEEFNMSQDRDSRKVLKTLMSSLFPTHPYGQQTTIGKAEHLKNPSMVNIHNYWNTYYVPNNIALCLSGDLNPESTIQLIDKYFGKFESKDVPTITQPVEAPITAHIEKEVFGPDVESLNFAYRFKGVDTEDEKMVSLIDMLLNNSQAGLIDLNLIQKQKVLRAGCHPSFMKDYGTHTFYGYPRQGQTLEEVKDLILAEIEKVKKGEFEDWLLEAVVNDMKLSEIRSMEHNSRAYSFVNAFLRNVPWINRVSYVEELEKITKEEIVAFANEHYKDNYVLVYKRQGEDKDVVKVEKPQISPVEINRNDQSSFMKSFLAMNSEKMQPEFIDFEKRITSKTLDSKIDFSYLENTSNELFSLNYIIDMGKLHNKKLPVAVNYLPYLGTDKYSASELQQEFYKLGISMNVYTGDERSYVYISGLKKSFKKGVELLEHVLKSAKPDTAVLKEYIAGLLKKRGDAKLSKSTILFRGLGSYGKYGANNPFKYNLTNDELQALTADELVAIIKEIYSFKHQVFYYGQRQADEVAAIINQYHLIPDSLKDYPAVAEFPEQEISKSKVYFVNYDMVQAQIMMISRDVPFNKDLLPASGLFGEYFGGSMASIVFQEIREARALAYSASSWYSTPSKAEDHFYVGAYIATQANKLNDATQAIMELLSNMPKSEESFNMAKESIIRKIETERITKANIFWTYLSKKKQGIDYDNRKDLYEFVKTATFEDLQKFFDEHIKGHKYIYVLIGNKKMLNMKSLKKLGKVKELDLEEVFGY